MASKQMQKAGNNSQQTQKINVIVNIGLDDARARAIYHELNLNSRKEFTQDAMTIANSRVAELENQLLPKMEAIDGALEAFADPSFQLLLVEAQKAAASTERPADYELLSELLINRFLSGENRITRAGISRAIEIVDKISNDALLGLTVFHSVSCFFPTTGDIHEGLNLLNDLFGTLFYSNLPKGNEWLDHLDILDAIRINTLGNLKKFDQYCPQILNGYVAVGIEKKSENHNKAIDLLTKYKLPQNVLVEHALNNNFLRINVCKEDQIDLSTIQDHVLLNNNAILFSLPITEEQKNAIKSIHQLYNQDQTIKQENVNRFMEEWNKRQNLKTLREWWDSINTSIQITSVGRVLAHSNAQRCDKGLPSLIN